MVSLVFIVLTLLPSFSFSFDEIDQSAGFNGFDRVDQIDGIIFEPLDVQNEVHLQQPKMFVNYFLIYSLVLFMQYRLW
jgi:hypothetical protein